MKQAEQRRRIAANQKRALLTVAANANAAAAAAAAGDGTAAAAAASEGQVVPVVTLGANKPLMPSRYWRVSGGPFSC